MTRNQRLVLRWFEEHCSASDIIRVSADEIALIFNWSHQYTKKILRSLVDDGDLEILQRGTGRRATKYRVIGSSGNQNGSSGNQRETAQHVPSGNQKRVGPFRYISTPRNSKYADTNVQEHVRNVFEKFAVDIYTPVRVNNSPFKRFKTHWDRVEKWSGPDFVCYFSHVHRVRFGDSPTIDWPKNVGAARTLLRRIGDPLAFKTFIQVAFSLCKRRPDGLYTFSYGRTYQDIKDILASEVPEEILDEYDDEQVFPWLLEDLKRRSREAALEYQRNLNKVYLGL